MSDILSIGASGVRAYQTAIGTVSENIANAGNDGYSRRTTDLSEVAASSSSISRRATASAGGVLATGVSRAADPIKAADVRSAGADLARSDTAITWLDRIETALTGNQLSSRLTGFFTATKAVAADPSASGARSTLLEASTGVASAFAGTGSALGQVASDLDATADNAVQTLGDLGAALAKVNDGLGRAPAGTSGSAQLLDQRDQILEQMSALSDVSVTTDATGRASVRLGGGSGPVLVAGSESGYVTYVRNDEGAVSFAVHRAGTVEAAPIAGGALAGIAEGAQRLAAARQEVNRIATGFVDGVNAVQAQGRDLDGNPGAAIFAAGDDPTDISLVLTDPRGIAAAAVGGGTRDNSNLAGFDALRTDGGFEDATTNLISGNAATLASRKTVAQAQASIHDGAIAARDAVSGVNLDNEAVDLLRFQQAYSASSRVIQTARDIFQSILEIR